MGVGSRVGFRLLGSVPEVSVEQLVKTPTRIEAKRGWRSYVESQGLSLVLLVGSMVDIGLGAPTLLSAGQRRAAMGRESPFSGTPGAELSPESRSNWSSSPLRTTLPTVESTLLRTPTDRRANDFDFDTIIEYLSHFPLKRNSIGSCVGPLGSLRRNLSPIDDGLVVRAASAERYTEALRSGVAPLQSRRNAATGTARQRLGLVDGVGLPFPATAPRCGSRLSVPSE